MKDLLTVEDNNPAKVLKAHYELLMAEQDPERLAADVVDLMKGSQISAKNLAKQVGRVQAIRDNLDRLRFFVSNFILAAGGDPVLNVGPRF